MTRPFGPVPALVEEYKGWWLERLNGNEIHKLAQGLWGDMPDDGERRCIRCGAKFNVGINGARMTRQFCSEHCRKRDKDWIKVPV